MNSATLPFWDRRNTTASTRLFCLPHAGGGALTYRDWVPEGDPDLDIQPVQLPGREGQAGTSLVDGMTTLVNELLGPAIADASDLPIVLFGHSMGAAIAAEVTAWLLRYGPGAPELLVVSCYSGHSNRMHHHGAGATDEELIEEVLSMGGTDPLLFKEISMRAYFLEIMRNDLRLLRTYRRSYRRLPVPILAVAGGTDHGVTPADLAAWQNHTAFPLSVYVRSGGHFPLAGEVPHIVNAVREELLRRTRTRGTGVGECSDA